MTLNNFYFKKYFSYKLQTIHDKLCDERKDLSEKAPR